MPLHRGLASYSVTLPAAATELLLRRVNMGGRTCEADANAERGGEGEKEAATVLAATAPAATAPPATAPPAIAPAAEERGAKGRTKKVAAVPLRYFRLEVEEQKLLLRRLVLYSFSFWLLLGLLLWWWVTEVPRAPVPLLQSYFFAARTHAASRVSPVVAAFAPAAATPAAAAQAAAAAEAEVAAAAVAAAAGGEVAAAAETAAAETAAAAAATLAAAALHRGARAAVFGPLQQQMSTHGGGSVLPPGGTAGSNSSNAAAVASAEGKLASDSTSRTPHAHAGTAAEEEEEAASAVAASSLLLPPLSLVFGLRLLPLCAAAAEDAKLFFRLLLSRSSAAKQPLHRSLFSSDGDDSEKWRKQQRSLPLQQHQQREQQKTEEETGEEPVTSVEASFTAALDVVFGDSAAAHARGEGASMGINSAAGEAATAAGAAQEAAAAEARQRVLLQQSASLSLLRVELLQPLSSGCAAAHSSRTAAAGAPGSSAEAGASAFSSAAGVYPGSWSRAAAVIAQENEAALVYTVAFSAAVAPQPHRREEDAAAPGEPHRRKKRTKQQETNNSEDPDAELGPPEIVLHADSAATVYSVVRSASPSQQRSCAAAASFSSCSASPAAASAEAASWSSSFALHEGAAALFHLLRTTVFRSHAPPPADAVIPGQYELSFWLAGDPPPHSMPLQRQEQQPDAQQQQGEKHETDAPKQQWTDAQMQQQRRGGLLLPQRATEWVRMRWNFQRDVLRPYLLPFFSRAALLFTFPTIQSQVVPLSGIASLLKKATDYFPRFGAKIAAVSSPAFVSPATGTPAAVAAGTDDLYVLDVASQHQLHAVSSRWQPQQIVSIPTYFPAPLLNFVYYKPPVPTVILHEVHTAPTAATAVTHRKVLLATYGVSIPAWGALVVGSSPAAASAATPHPPSDSDAAAVSAASVLAPPSAVDSSPVTTFPLVAGSAPFPPIAAAAAAPAAATRLSDEELRYASGMWVAQLRSICLLPRTLQDYFFSPADAAAAAADREERAAAGGEGSEEKHQAAGSTVLLGEGWQAELVNDAAGSVDSSTGGALVLRVLQRQARGAEGQHVQQQAAAARRKEATDAMGGEGAEGGKTAAAGGRGGSTGEITRRRNPHVRVVVEAAAAGAGLWEVWGVARQVYVHFMLQALKNIHRLQSIIRSQPELVVLPHISEALQRALLLIDCSAEAAVLHRICTQLPPSLKRLLVEEPASSPFAAAVPAAGIPVAGGFSPEAGEQQQQSSDTSKISNARFLFFALALARAAFQDSLEVLHDESVAAKSHFGFEFKCAIYLPFSLPFLVPVLVGLLKLRKQKTKLSKIAELHRFA